MPSKYVIITKTADPRFPPVGKYATVEFREDCAGSCRDCVKKKCVYSIYKDNYRHWREVPEPEFLYNCKSCYRCIEECTKGIFSMTVNPEYRRLGDNYWTPHIINSTWAQAHTGKIPVSGAGYRGPFTGEGFDAIWTDMSEIVRPTRDGIHGREYINTMVELSRRPMRLEFNDDMSLAHDLPPILEVPLPVLFQPPRFGVLSENELLAMALAAQRIGTLLLLPPGNITGAFDKFSANLVPCLTGDNYRQYPELIQKSRMIELAYAPGIEEELAVLRATKPDLCIAIGLPLDADAATRAGKLAPADVDTIHFYGSDHAREVGAPNPKPRHLVDMLREIHLKLVADRQRHRVNLVFSGGIALAEHAAKALLCGADAVAIDVPLLIALECRLCYRCREGETCPVKIGDAEVNWASQRITNLAGAWHGQLLEVMGACGIREARRLRGEIGRTMWFEDLERESFGPIFGTRKVR
jgi:ferredoxin